MCEYDHPTCQSFEAFRDNAIVNGFDCVSIGEYPAPVRSEDIPVGADRAYLDWDDPQTRVHYERAIAKGWHL